MDDSDIGYYTHIYNNAPTRTEFCILQFMIKNPNKNYYVDDIKKQFTGFLWNNPNSVYRIVNSMERKGLIYQDEYRVYRLTALGVELKVI